MGLGSALHDPGQEANQEKGGGADACINKAFRDGAVFLLHCFIEQVIGGGAGVSVEVSVCIPFQA